MNEEKIRIRRKCCQLLEKTGMQKILTKQCDEQLLLDGCQKVMESEAACLLYTSPSPRDLLRSRMPSSA